MCLVALALQVPLVKCNCHACTIWLTWNVHKSATFRRPVEENEPEILEILSWRKQTTWLQENKEIIQISFLYHCKGGL